jgi:hypothetical protein
MHQEIVSLSSPIFSALGQVSILQINVNTGKRAKDNGAMTYGHNPYRN